MNTKDKSRQYRVQQERMQQERLRQERLRREMIRKKKLRQKRIRRNRILALTVLIITGVAIMSIFNLMKRVPAFSDIIGGIIGNNDGKDNESNNGGNKGTDIVEKDFSIKKINDYKNGFSQFIELTMTEKDFYRGSLVLVNHNRSLPFDFKPKKLVNMFDNRVNGAFGLKNTTMELEEEAYSTINEMFGDLNNDGAGLCVIVSAHRTIQYQQTLLDLEVTEYKNQGYDDVEAMAKALEFVARPGHSEHNYGYAIDVSAQGTDGYLLTGEFELTTQGEWLYKNSWKYGYIIRYPKDKINITKIGYEPWHLRYVGYPHSAIMKKLNLCLEEYIDYIYENKAFDFSINDEKYRIFYVDSSDMAKTNGTGYELKIPVFDPSAQNGRDFTISGDGDNGFIVTVKMDG